MPTVGETESKGALRHEVVLGLDDYRQALWFALRMWYHKEPGRIEHGGWGKRSLSAFVTNILTGKLSELAFARFLDRKFGKVVTIDMEVRPTVQKIRSDVVSVLDGEYRPPRISLDVIGTSINSKYLVVGDVDLRNRPPEAYVLVLVDLPRDHMIKLIAPSLRLSIETRKMIGELSEVRCLVCGFATSNAMKSQENYVEKNSWLTLPDRPKRRLVRLREASYVMRIDKLHNSEGDWRKLLLRL